MIYEELFVGAVSVLLGMGGLIAAIANQDVCYRLDKIRWLEAVAGRWCARLVYALLGVMLIVLGVAIASGFRPHGGTSLPPGSPPGHLLQGAPSQ